MEWWQILVGILMFILALGVLVGIHELGHLGAAKLFNVYCFDYSIGFGPKLIGTKRSAKHETTWTLRAIPLGGFVSMYGEGMPNEEGVFIPPNRSLEGIARHKRAVVISAGVILNFVLGFVLITLHNGCFDHVWFDFNKHGNDTSVVCNFKNASDLKNGDELKVTQDLFANTFLLAKDITLNGEPTSYVLCMDNLVTTTKIDPLLSDSLKLYIKKDLDREFTDSKYSENNLITIIRIVEGKSEAEAKKEIKNLSLDKRKERYFNDIYSYYNGHGFEGVAIDSDDYYHVKKETKLSSVSLKFYTDSAEEQPIEHKISLQGNDRGTFNDCGIYLQRQFEHYDFAKTMKVSWQEWCGANTAVFRGLASLFTGKGQLSGPLMIATMSTNVLANFGFERYLYLWGMISCNLAILNLLPFPGLDGWALVVIAYEGITKKKIPTKVKGIVSVIGLGLLFLLMIGVFVMDIIRLIV